MAERMGSLGQETEEQRQKRLDYEAWCYRVTQNAHKVVDDAKDLLKMAQVTTQRLGEWPSPHILAQGEQASLLKKYTRWALEEAKRIAGGYLRLPSSVKCSGLSGRLRQIPGARPTPDSTPNPYREVVEWQGKERQNLNTRIRVLVRTIGPQRLELTGGSGLKFATVELRTLITELKTTTMRPSQYLPKLPRSRNVAMEVGRTFRARTEGVHGFVWVYCTAMQLRHIFSLSKTELEAEGIFAGSTEMGRQTLASKMRRYYGKDFDTEQLMWLISLVVIDASGSSLYISPVARRLAAIKHTATRVSQLPADKADQYYDTLQELMKRKRAAW